MNWYIPQTDINGPVHGDTGFLLAITDAHEQPMLINLHFNQAVWVLPEVIDKVLFEG